MVILQGPPGSGKTTFAKKIFPALTTVKGMPLICSTDDYFYDEVTLEYNYDPNRLPEFHLANQNRALWAIRTGHSVIIDNTNIRAWEARTYVQIAKDNNVQVVFVRLNGRFTNTHGVPEDRVEYLSSMMEDLSEESCLSATPPWSVRNPG